MAKGQGQILKNIPNKGESVKDIKHLMQRFSVSKQITSFTTNTIGFQIMLNLLS